MIVNTINTHLCASLFNALCGRILGKNKCLDTFNEICIMMKRGYSPQDYYSLENIASELASFRIPYSMLMFV